VERHLGLSTHKADLPSSLLELVSWTRRRFLALTTLRSITTANSVTLYVGIGLYSVQCMCVSYRTRLIDGRLLCTVCFSSFLIDIVNKKANKSKQKRRKDFMKICLHFLGNHTQ